MGAGECSVWLASFFLISFFKTLAYDIVCDSCTEVDEVRLFSLRVFLQWKNRVSIFWFFFFPFLFFYLYLLTDRDLCLYHTHTTDHSHVNQQDKTASETTTTTTLITCKLTHGIYSEERVRFLLRASSCYLIHTQLFVPQIQIFCFSKLLVSAEKKT